jgi:hypothetical protein
MIRILKRTKALQQDKPEALMPLEKHQRQKLRRAEIKELQPGGSSPPQRR